MQTDLHELDIRLSAILMAFVSAYIVPSGQTIGLRLWFDDVQSDMDLPLFGPNVNVIVIASSTNAVNTDTNAKFCVFKSGTNIQIKNRLGATKIIKYELKY